MGNRHGTPADPPKGMQLYDLPDKAKTGDLLVLTKEEETHYGILLKDKEVGPRTPLLVARTAKNEDGSYGLRVSTANYTIVYQGYTEASLRRLTKPVEFSYEQANSLPSTTAKNDTAKGLLMQVYSSVFGLQLPGENPEAAEDPDQLPLEAPENILWTQLKDGPLVQSEKSFTDWLHRVTSTDVSSQPHKSLEEILKDLKTGDIVVSAGVGVGGAFMRVTDVSIFSHASIVVRDPYIDQPCLWESIGNDEELTDLDTGKIVKGVTLIPFPPRCELGWDGPVAVRHLVDISEEKREAIRETLIDLRTEFQGRPFEKDVFELVRAKVDFMDKYLPFFRAKEGEEALDSLFCSELVSFAYISCGLLKPGKAASEYTPRDFSTKADKPLELIEGKLENEVYVNLPFMKNA